MKSSHIADFEDRHRTGKRSENALDQFFSQYFKVFSVRSKDQRRGIDRVFENEQGQRFNVEIKADSRAHNTGNAFIETVSVDARNVPGWAYSSQADVLLYYVTSDEVVYWILFSQLRLRLPAWEARYEKRTIPNKDWNTIGLLVPLAELEAAAEVVYCL